MIQKQLGAGYNEYFKSATLEEMIGLNGGFTDVPEWA